MFCFWAFRLACVVEHLTDLGSESGDDGGVEESVETCEDDTADDNADDDFHTGVDIALAGGGFDGSLCGNNRLVELVLDVVNEILHVFITSFFLNFVFFDYSGSITD